MKPSIRKRRMIGVSGTDPNCHFSLHESSLILTSSWENSTYDLYSSHVVRYGYWMRDPPLLVHLLPLQSCSFLLVFDFQLRAVSPSFHLQCSLGLPLILYSQSIHFRGSPLEFLSFPATMLLLPLVCVPPEFIRPHAILGQVLCGSLIFFFVLSFPFFFIRTFLTLFERISLHCSCAFRSTPLSKTRHRWNFYVV